MAKVTLFSMVHFGCFLFFYIGIYREDEESQNRETLENLMVIYLFRKKAVPLYRQRKRNTNL